jgi:hypothetical protein
MMSAVPLLSARQWNEIIELLPTNRRNPILIAAILFHQTSGCGLREVAQSYGVSRSRLHEWSKALEIDGSLANVLETLQLNPAGPLARRGGGPAWYAHNKALAAEIAAIKLNEFRQALRSEGRSFNRRPPHAS